MIKLTKHKNNLSRNYRSNNIFSDNSLSHNSYSSFQYNQNNKTSSFLNYKYKPKIKKFPSIKINKYHNKNSLSIPKNEVNYINNFLSTSSNEKNNSFEKNNLKYNKNNSTINKSFFSRKSILDKYKKINYQLTNFNIFKKIKNKKLTDIFDFVHDTQIERSLFHKNFDKFRKSTKNKIQEIDLKKIYNISLGKINNIKQVKKLNILTNENLNDFPKKIFSRRIETDVNKINEQINNIKNNKIISESKNNKKFPILNNNIIINQKLKEKIKKKISIIIQKSCETIENDYKNNKFTTEEIKPINNINESLKKKEIIQNLQIINNLKIPNNDEYNKKLFKYLIYLTLNVSNLNININNKNSFYKKFKKIIIKASIKFKNLNISLSKFLSLKNKLPTQPYQQEKSKKFFDYIKSGNLEMVKYLLENNNLLLYDYDFFHQNALHWIVKSNNFQFISYLIKKGIDINATDFLGRTPLHIACFLNNLECILTLLYEMAYPFFKDKSGNTPEMLNKDSKIKYIFKRVKLLYLFHSINKSKYFEQNVKNGLVFFYKYELGIEIFNK